MPEDRSFLPLGQPKAPEDPPQDARRRLVLGLTAGAGLIAVAVVAGALVVVGSIAFVHWFISSQVS